MLLSTSHRSKWQKITLAAGDWLALGLFVFLGQLEHGLVGAFPLPRLLAGAAELALPWTVAALLWGAYRVTAAGSGREFLGRSLTAWLVAAPLALMLRAFLRGQDTIIVVFMLVTMGLGGLFLLGWRALYLLAWRRFSGRL